MTQLVLQKKYKKAIEQLRAEFQKGNRSLELRLQYADVLAKAGEKEKAIPVLLGLASELDAAGSHDQAKEMLGQADRIEPGRADVAARRQALAARATKREQADEAKAREDARDADSEPSPAATPLRADGPSAGMPHGAAGLAGADSTVHRFGDVPLQDPTLFDSTPADGSVLDDVVVDNEAPLPLDPSVFDVLPAPPEPRDTGAAPSPVLAYASDADGQNDAVFLFGPALAPPNFASPEAPAAAVEPEVACEETVACEEFVSASIVEPASAPTLEESLAAVEATLSLDEWQDDDAAPDFLWEETSAAHEAKPAIDAEGGGQEGMLAYVQRLAARFPSTDDAPPSPSELAGALFGGLSAAELRPLLTGVSRKDFDPGHVMVREGERGGGVFILARGRARVLVQGEHSRPFEVAELTEGSFFGEVTLLSRPRSATVVASGPCELLEIAPEALEALAEGRPRVRQIVEETLVDRSNSLEVAAVRAVPPMDEAIPSQAVRVLEAQFGVNVKSSRMRLRLAELLARTGNYVDVVPVLVGLAEEMQSAGQPARAIAILKKIEAIDHQGPKEVGIAPLAFVPFRPDVEGPGSAIVSYVTTGQPTPSAGAAEHFRHWLEDQMSDAREAAAGAASEGWGEVESELDARELAAKVEGRVSA